MKLNKLFEEDDRQFKSLEDVRQAAIDDLEKVNKALTDAMEGMNETVDKVTKTKDKIAQLKEKLEEAIETGDPTVARMIKQNIAIQKQYLDQVTNQYEMYKKNHAQHELAQKKLMHILSSKSNLEKVYDKLAHPGDITKQAPADLLLQRLSKAGTSPDTASPTDVRGMGRKLAS